MMTTEWLLSALLLEVHVCGARHVVRPLLPLRVRSSTDIWPTSASVDVETAPIEVSADAINMLACHLIWLHRNAIVRLINGVACSSYTVNALNHALGEAMTIQGDPSCHSDAHQMPLLPIQSTPSNTLWARHASRHCA